MNVKIAAIRAMLTAGWILLLASPLSLAADRILVISATSRYYLLEEDAAGALSLHEVTKIIKTDGTPPDSPDPDPPDVGEVQKKVKEWAIAVGDPTTARALSSAYGLVSKRVADGSLTAEQSFQVLAAATDLVLREQDADAAWQPFRDNVSNLLARMKQEGGLTTVAQHVAVFKEIEAGLKDASSDEGILDEIDLERLLELIKLIIELIQTFIL